MTLSWLSIVRLGLIQMCLGSIVVLTTSTLNRLMVVELALPAVLPGLLVALHYGIQITRPNWGFLSDKGGNRGRWIILGMAVLGAGALLASYAIIVLERDFTSGMAVSVLAYALIGLGVGASGTSVLALLATATAPERRAAAATITWLMMIGGIAVTATIVGGQLDPYSHALLVRIVWVVTGAALALTIVSIWGVERGLVVASEPDPMPFREGLAEIWAERKARNFTFFVFLSMVAYFMQELILEPYAGLVFAFEPGESTALSGGQNGGVFMGMVAVGVMVTGLAIGSLKSWVVAGCIGSAFMLIVIAALGRMGEGAPLMPAVIGLGFFNGVFAVAAIGSMMALAGQGRERREGTRMGLWGAAQAIAAGSGGLLGAAMVDLMRGPLPDANAFGIVFGFEAVLFLTAAFLAHRVMEGRAPSATLVPGE
ncbi:MAG: BCD family MFS transporter [Pseudomonadota bacterium]